MIYYKDWRRAIEVEMNYTIHCNSRGRENTNPIHPITLGECVEKYMQEHPECDDKERLKKAFMRVLRIRE